MPLNLRGRSLITIAEWTTAEVHYVLELSKQLKLEKNSGVDQRKLLGNTSKAIVVIMQKTSTRTRSAFETAAFDLGMNVSYIGPYGSHIGKKESIEDTAKVLGRFYDGIAFRGYKTKDVEILAKYSGVPVWNALTNDWHPTQVFADYLTILQEFHHTKVKFVFFGDVQNNMGNSLLLMAAHMGAHFVGCAPKTLWPNQEIINKAKKIALNTGAKFEFEEDPIIAAKDADVVYTDVWVSMGEPEEIWKERIKLLKPYQVNMKIMKTAKNSAIFLHCLPAFHNLKTEIGIEIEKKFNLKEMEVTDEVFRSTFARQFKQAENRAHTIKAIMLATLGY